MSEAAKRFPRVLLVVVGLLLCSNLATAFVAYLTIARLDERYTNEVAKAVPGLHEVILLAQDSTNTHRAAGNLLLARDQDEAKVMRARLADARQQELERLTVVFAKGPPEAGDAMEPLWLASRNYNQSLEDYLAFIRSGDRDAALAYRLDILRPIFDAYQTRQREESIRLNFDAVRANTELSAQAKSRKSMLLGFGGWPFAVMLVMLVGLGILGGALWRQLRHIESDEKKLRSNNGF
jgi:hypothetical protein